MAKKPRKNPSKSSAYARLVRERGANWLYDAKTRGAYNPMTDERISRRQLDVKYGILGAEGHTSYEAKAKSRSSLGLAGFKRGKFFGWYEATYKSRSAFVRAMRAMPPHLTALIAVQGHVYSGRSGAPGRDKWRLMNPYRPMMQARTPVGPLLEKYLDDKEGAESVVSNPTRWGIRAKLAITVADRIDRIMGK